MVAAQKPPDEPWADAVVIYQYTRADAIEDGVLVDLMQHPTPERPELDDLCSLVREAGFRVPVAITATAFNETVAPTDGELPPGQNLKGRLWDVLMALRVAGRLRADDDRVHFKVAVWNGKKREDVALWALCGPGDDAKPVLTIMLEGED